MAEETKQVRLILSDSVVELEGTPEELVEKIQGILKLDNVIPFPARGIYAHPANPNWKGQ